MTNKRYRKSSYSVQITNNDYYIMIDNTRILSETLKKRLYNIQVHTFIRNYNVHNATTHKVNDLTKNMRYRYNNS